jgi:hypothetical protein
MADGTARFLNPLKEAGRLVRDKRTPVEPSCVAGFHAVSSMSMSWFNDVQESDTIFCKSEG